MPEAPLADAIDRVLAVFAQSAAGALVPAEQREQRRRRAAAQATAPLYGSAGPTLALLSLAADLLADAAVDLAAQRASVSALLAAIERETGIGPVAIARELVRAPQLGELPTELAMEVQLVLLSVVAGVGGASVSTVNQDGSIAHLAHCGHQTSDERQLGRLAAAALTQSSPAAGASRGLAWTWIDRTPDAPVALIAHGRPVGDDHRAELLEAATPLAGAILARYRREMATNDGQQVLGAVERRLARLRFDLHDGPQQDVHLLATDLALFRKQIIPLLEDHPDFDRVIGRLDDLSAQLVALDNDLRRLATTVQSPFLSAGSFDEQLLEIIDAFTARSGIRPAIARSGDASELTDSQRLTLLALVREALSNVREHSRAGRAAVTIHCDDDGVRAEIEDDGCGFDPETVLVQAARRGHLGLVGMHERVRMLGGDTTIESRAGRTVVSAFLPPWRPTVV